MEKRFWLPLKKSPVAPRKKTFPTPKGRNIFERGANETLRSRSRWATYRRAIRRSSSRTKLSRSTWTARTCSRNSGCISPAYSRRVGCSFRKRSELVGTF